MFLNNFLIKNKCLINLEHIDMRTQVKSKRVMTDRTWSAARSGPPSPKLWESRRHRRSPDKVR